MSDISVEEHNEHIRFITRQKKKEWILIAVALALTVLSIVALSIGSNYLPKVTHEEIDNYGVHHIVFDGMRYKELEGVLACMIAAVIGNFILFVVLKKTIWFSKKTGDVSLVCRIIKAALHIVATLLIFIMAIVTAGLYLSANTTSGVDIWIMGAYGMCTMGETITFLVYYWNERFARGPAGSDITYLCDHAKLFNRHEKACEFTKFYIAVPYVAYLLGYFLSVLFGYLGTKFGLFFCGGVQLLALAAAVILSIYFFFKKNRISKYELDGFYARRKTSGERSSSGSSHEHSESSETKPVDNNYAAGKKRLSSELYEYNGLKFLPSSYDLPTYVSNARLSVNLNNKDSFGSSGKLIIRGSITCDIKREEMHPGDAAQKVLSDVIDNIKSRANDILYDLSDKYSNYNKSFTIDCSGIKVSYKIV